MLTRACRPIASAALLTLVAGGASAELPSVLDYVPAGSYGGVVAPSLLSMDRATQNLFAAVGMPVLTTPSQMFAEAGFIAGLDMERPIAMVVVDGPMDGDQPPIALFIPTMNAAALFDGLGARAVDGGLYSMTLNGDATYAKVINDGYVLLAPMRDTVANYEAVDGQLEAHASRLGSNGMSVAEGSQVFGFINMPAIEPLLADEWDEFEEGLRSGMDMGMAMGMGGDQNAEADQLAAEMTQIARDFVEDGLYGVFGLQAGARGVGFEMAMDFEEGSETAQMFAGAGDSKSLLAQLPNKPFIYAMATDASAKGFERISNLAKQMGQMGGAAGGGDWANLLSSVENATGYASALYPTPGGMMGGLFAGMVNYTRIDDAREIVDDMEKLAAGDEPGAMTMTFTKSETQLNGMPVHGWSMGMQMDPNNPASMQMMQMSQMLFGGPQISGYLIEAEGGVYQTMSRNLALVQGVAGDGDGALGANQQITQIRETLPTPAVFEGYLGVRSLYEMISPLAAMFGMPIQTPVPQDLPPVGSALATGDSGFRGAVYIPAPVLRVGVGLGMELQAMQQGMGGPGNGAGRNNQTQEDAPF